MWATVLSQELKSLNIKVEVIYKPCIQQESKIYLKTCFYFYIDTVKFELQEDPQYTDSSLCCKDAQNFNIWNGFLVQMFSGKS